MRQQFLSFLERVYLKEPEYYDRICNIRYRADELHRNYNDNDSDITNRRSKNSLIEEELGDMSEMTIEECGHLITYAAYCDNNSCCLCDKKLIGDLYEKKRK